MPCLPPCLAPLRSTFCKQGRALRALANVGNCPPGAPVFKCKKYGCVLQRTCPADKGAKCVYAAPCTKFFRLDYLDQPCGGGLLECSIFFHVLVP